MKTYQHALFLYNGNAGQDGLEEKLTATLPVLLQAIKHLSIVQADSIKDAQKICVHFSETIDLLIILGGDGTVHTCLNAIAPLQKRPTVAILPGGTCNDFSRMLRMPQQLKEAASAIVNGKIVDVDVGKANDAYFLNFWGIGVVAETSQNIDEGKKKNIGVLSYFVSALKTVSKATSFRYSILTGNKTYQGEAVMIFVLNGRFLGTQEIPIANLQPDDGKLDVLIVKNSNLAFFRELLSLNDPETKLASLNEMMYLQTDSLYITTEKPKEVDMDGEITLETPSKITLLPHHLQMIQAR